MPEPEYLDEYLRRLKALQTVGLASEHLPPINVGIFPEPGSGWHLRVVEHSDSEEKSNWYVTDLGIQMLDEPDVAVFDEGIEQIGWINTGQARKGRPSPWKAILSLTVFLPLMLILAILRFPSRPGSPYTLGQVVLGFGSVLAWVGFIYALFQGNWLLVGLAVYWWIGSKVIESEARKRGHVV